MVTPLNIFTLWVCRHLALSITELLDFISPGLLIMLWTIFDSMKSKGDREVACFLCHLTAEMWRHRCRERPLLHQVHRPRVESGDKSWRLKLIFIHLYSSSFGQRLKHPGGTRKNYWEFWTISFVSDFLNISQVTKDTENYSPNSFKDEPFSLPVVKSIWLNVYLQNDTRGSYQTTWDWM